MLTALALVPLLSLPLAAQGVETEYEGSAALGLVLRQMGVVKRVLMIAAHPDDEATQVLSTLALGQGADVAYLSLTRGEGGQNGIGLEMAEGLGLIRSEELLAARRLDGADQYFTRALDWGFSKNADEAFRMWPREALLADVVAVVRHFRPDVIVSVFSGTPRDGHGQHQAAGIVALDAFHAAPDPARFPDQLAEGLRPHGPTHLYQLVRGVEDTVAVELETGTFDPLLGASHFQVAMASRSRHRSQDMGRLQTPGPQSTRLSLAATRAESAPGSLFAGVDTTLSQRVAAAQALSPYAGAERLGSLVAAYEAAAVAILDGYNPLRPERIVPLVAGALRDLDEAVTLAPASDLRDLLLREREKAGAALLRAARVTVDATVTVEKAVPGQSFPLEVVVWNGGTEAVEVEAVQPRLPAGWTAIAEDAAPAHLAPDALVRRIFSVSVPKDAAATEPYFLRLPREGARYAWPAGAGPVGVPFEPDEVRVSVGVRVGGATAGLVESATFRGLDLKSGEYRRPVRVVPAVAVTLEPGLAVVPIVRAAEPVRFSVRVVAEQPEGIAGTLHIEAPEGWRVEPAALPMRFAEPGEETVEVAAYAPATLAPARLAFRARFEDEAGRSFDRGYALVDYPHIRPRPRYRDAVLQVQTLDVALPADLRIGYVQGPGDDIPAALAQIGVQLELLGPAELAAAPLDGFDAIVVGIRAYDGRPDLVAHNRRLLDYTRRGGTLIVQYNRYEYLAPGLAPFEIEMARPHDRVTDHEAEVRLLDPSHPIFTTPNPLGPDDWAGWVHERGLYFLSRWDDRLTPLIEMNDPGEAPTRGALLIAEYGEGTYVYSGLALFRQLPAGVPGAYRLFANLLALGAR